MKTAALLIIGAAIPLLAAGCGSQPMSSSPTTTTATATVSNKMVLANGQFTPASVTIAAGKKVTFVFDGMGSDHIEILNNGHRVAQSPLLGHGASWSYVFNAQGQYTAEPQTMTYIHAVIKVS